MTTKTKVGKVKAIQSCVVVVGARAPEWRKVIVRDRPTQKLAEVSLAGEEDPIDPGDPGRTYAFQRGEEIDGDHEAVLDAPGAFVAVDG